MQQHGQLPAFLLLQAGRKGQLELAQWQSGSNLLPASNYHQQQWLEQQQGSSKRGKRVAPLAMPVPAGCAKG